MNREEDAVDARREGKDARKAGKPITANEFSIGTLRHRCWNEGWLAEDRYQSILEQASPLM